MTPTTTNHTDSRSYDGAWKTKWKRQYGLALKAQRDGQPFSSAAMETLQKHFPDIPSDILAERSEVLQKTREELIVNKYGGVITMRPLSTGRPKALNSSKTANEDIAAGASSENTDAADRWSPSKPSPERRKKHTMVHIPDLDALVIADSEDDEDIPIHSPRVHGANSTSPIKLSKWKRSLELNREPQSPQSIDPKTATLGSNKEPNRPWVSQKNSPAKVLANSIPAVTSEAPVARNEPPHKFGLGSLEHSPMEKMLNNKASRLRTQSNLEKITSFGAPKHSRLKFEQHGLMRSPSPSRSRPSPAKDAEAAAASFAAIDSFFQNSPRRLKDKKHEEENIQRSDGNTPKSSPVKIVKPPLNRYFTNESGPRPSSLVFQMDEDMQFQGPPSEYMGSSTNDSVACDGNIEISVQGETIIDIAIPQILSDITEPYHNQPIGHPKQCMAKTSSPAPKRPTVRRISLQGMQDDEQLETETELIRPEDPSQPAILNVKVGSRGLIVNIHCVGDLVMGETPLP
ncbi:hypothetical protein TWF718_007601 [Orbilia javanica]|uniref:Uncharacterized protein n=1 Tax=Orbilia javanica TaxID=47235 RepID=A0AAN8N0U9_9PEZI